MSVLISIILIVISIIVILAIIITRLPALAILDINNISEEKENKFKAQIMKNRLERDVNKINSVIARYWLKFYKKISNILDSLEKYLQDKRQNYKFKASDSVTNKGKKIKKLFLDVEDLLSKERLEKAENKLIEIISLDHSNVLAFFKLGTLYKNLKHTLEARQSYHYVIKLLKHGDNKIDDLNFQQIYFALSLLEKEENDIDKAFDYIIDALDLEPNNPRYLDLILDLSIMKKDKELAQKYFNRLLEVNPDNNKLEKLQKTIEEL